MEVINKTADLEKWQVKDIVETKEGRKGIIQEDQNGVFNIVRLDDKFQGDYDEGLTYAVSDNPENLRIENPSFFKINGNKNETWHEGDFVKDNQGKFGQVNKSDDGNYFIRYVNINTGEFLEDSSFSFKKSKQVKNLLSKIPQDKSNLNFGG